MAIGYGQWHISSRAVDVRQRRTSVAVHERKLVLHCSRIVRHRRAERAKKRQRELGSLTADRAHALVLTREEEGFLTCVTSHYQCNDMLAWVQTMPSTST